MLVFSSNHQCLCSSHRASARLWTLCVVKLTIVCYRGPPRSHKTKNHVLPSLPFPSLPFPLQLFQQSKLTKGEMLSSYLTSLFVQTQLGGSVIREAEHRPCTCGDYVIPFSLPVDLSPTFSPTLTAGVCVDGGRSRGKRSQNTTGNCHGLTLFVCFVLFTCFSWHFNTQTGKEAC